MRANKTNVTPVKFNRELLERIVKVVGIEATAALMDGAVLHIYRNSTPHNWWIAPAADEHDHLWHSSEEWSMDRVPPMKAFSLLNEEGSVSYGNNIMFQGRSDAGKAVHSKYRINPKMKQVWKRIKPEDLLRMAVDAEIIIK